MTAEKKFDARKSTGKLHVRSAAQPEWLPRIRALVADLAARVGFPEGEIDKIKMAVDEACTNVIEHAYGADGVHQWTRDPELTLELRVENQQLIVEIHDHGARFDLANYTPPSIEDGIRCGRTGGYGLAIIRQFMDEVQYQHCADGGNLLRLVKRLPLKKS